MGEFLPLIKEYGPLVAAVAWFMWRDWKREGHQATRINSLENEFRSVVIPLVEKVTEALTRNTEVMEENIKVMRDVQKVFER